MDILEEYRNNRYIYLDLKSKLEVLISSLIKSNSVNIHQLELRLKEASSLEKKIERKGGKYKSLNDITDVLGCRVITYFDDDVDRIASIIETEFQIDSENSIDKRKIDVDRFGYLSLHYVVELKNDRLCLTEYKNFKGMKFEVQIRSILQHSWAEIEHDIGYKGKFSIPDNAKRSFSRIAALLELADQEFVRLRELLIEYEKSVPNVVKKSPKTSKINNATLSYILQNNEIMIQLDSEISNLLNIDLEFESDFVSELVYRLNTAGFNTIDSLIQFIINNHDEIVKFSRYYRDYDKDRKERGSGINGISIYDLTAFKVMRDGDYKLKEALFDDQDDLRRVEQMYNHYVEGTEQ
jgi:putative GTP pyrophosphokinase